MEAEMEATTVDVPRKSRKSVFGRMGKGLLCFRKKSKLGRVEEDPTSSASSPATPKKDDHSLEGDEYEAREDGIQTPPLSPLQDKEYEEMSEHDPLDDIGIGVDKFALSMPMDSDEFQPSEMEEESDNKLSANGGTLTKRVTSFAKGTGFAKGTDFARNPSFTSAKSYGSTKSGRSRRSNFSSVRGRHPTVTLERAPDAKVAAFGGPPRYDWIDIETAAAVKVQAAFRRNKVMRNLERQGLSTAAMRNRVRARRSKQHTIQSDDVPFPFSLCGVGLLFGDATSEDRGILEARRKAEYAEKKRQQEEAEAKRRKLRFRRKGSEHVMEEFEVLDDRYGEY